MPTVSVVIPTYNRADVLPRAIDSALGQSVADIEVVVVDDGSTDDTEALVADYEDDRLRYVAHETNRGANVARNTGIEAADGEYIAFLDSDDEWKPTKLERQLERLEGEPPRTFDAVDTAKGAEVDRRVETGETTGAAGTDDATGTDDAAGTDDSDDHDWVAAYCDFETQLDGPTARVRSTAAALLARLDEDRPTEGGEELVAEFLADRIHPGAGSTLVVRADVARSVGGFDEELDRFQDPEFVLRILEEGNLAHVEEPLVVRHDTGAPAAETVAAADHEYLAKYEEEVDRAEANGADIRDHHRLIRAKHYLADGETLTGLRELAGATVRARQVPGLAWAAGTGIRRRTGSQTALAGAVALVSLGAVAAVVARLRSR